MPFDPESLKKSFEDELGKIKAAGELQGFTRSGRRPIGVDRLLEREEESTDTPSNVFADVNVPAEVFKKDIEKLSSLGRTMATAGLGAAAMLALQRANKDRKMGRQMRLQQDQSF
jgi:hypothetical protein